MGISSFKWDILYPGASNGIISSKRPFMKPSGRDLWDPSLSFTQIYKHHWCHQIPISCGFMVVPELVFQQCGRCFVYLVITAPRRAAMILWCLMFFDVWQSGFKKVMNTKKESTQFLGHWSFGHLMLRNLLVLLKITHVISRRSKIKDCNQQLSLLRQCLERMFWMNTFHNFHRSTVFSWLSLIIT